MSEETTKKKRGFWFQLNHAFLGGDGLLSKAELTAIVSFFGFVTILALAVKDLITNYDSDKALTWFIACSAYLGFNKIGTTLDKKMNGNGNGSSNEAPSY